MEENKRKENEEIIKRLKEEKVKEALLNAETTKEKTAKEKNKEEFWNQLGVNDNFQGWF